MIMAHLVHMAQEELPGHMGEKYTSAVVSCLTCTDEDNPDFRLGEEMRDEDGVVINWGAFHRENPHAYK